MQNRVNEARIKQRIDSLDFNLVRARLRVLQDPSVQGARDALQYFDSQLRERTTPSEAATQYGVALAALRLNQPQRAYAAAQASRRAARQQISPMLDKLVSEARHAAATSPAERAAAVADAREASQRFPLSRLSAIHHVQLLHLDNRSEEAVAYLRNQLALPRSDTTYFSLLSKSYGELGQRTLQHQATAEAYQLMGATPAAIEQLQLARKAADADFYVLSEVDARLRQLTQQYKEQREEMARNMRRPPPEDEGRKKDR